MENFTTITAYDFKFGGHPLCPMFSTTFNNTYAEPLETSVINQHFTNANKTTVAADVIVAIRTAIIDTILIPSTADRTVVTPIVNQMLICAYSGNPV